VIATAITEQSTCGVVATVKSPTVGSDWGLPQNLWPRRLALLTALIVGIAIGLKHEAASIGVSAYLLISWLAGLQGPGTA